MLFVYLGDIASLIPHNDASGDCVEYGLQQSLGFNQCLLGSLLVGYVFRNSDKTDNTPDFIL